MKRVKVMLTAIGVLAIIGGALAFKTKNVGASCYCATTDLTGSGPCNIKLTAASFHPIAGTVQMRYKLISCVQTCPQPASYPLIGWLVQ